MRISYWLKTKAKVVIIALIALGLTIFLSQTVFYKNSPTLQPGFLTNIQQSLSKLAALPGKLFKKQISPEEKLERNLATYPTIAPLPTVAPDIVQSLTFQPNNTGVSSTINPNDGQKYVRIEAGTVVEVQEFTLADGRRIKVIKPLVE